MDKLLRLLGENSSYTTAQLSMMLGESEDAIKARIKEYEDSGIIRGYQAVVNWDEVPDAGVMAMIELKVAPQMQKGFDDIAEKILAYDEVESVYLMAGAYDLLLTVKGRTIQDVSSFVAKRLAAMHGILSTATHFILKRYKEDGVPLVDKKKDGREMIFG
ncbi:MAG: Lrp/AsnC family transcriptional regulator [Ruminococcus sp.]|uniref:Lrp/AsnC family transcriptional regulator n=1 Tax=Ruminococcus sp. TaxID=41978 RepID=UPI002873C3BC|nr:Lrp/AsnC family transcriptional regulator [Ruminococcus sp.]MBQ3284365.1 Lrp/AsnC family transcriptional regulator [Ruminococcus sp.]